MTSICVLVRLCWFCRRKAAKLLHLKCSGIWKHTANYLVVIHVVVWNELKPLFCFCFCFCLFCINIDSRNVSAYKAYIYIILVSLNPTVVVLGYFFRCKCNQILRHNNSCSTLNPSLFVSKSVMIWVRSCILKVIMTPWYLQFAQL